MSFRILDLGAHDGFVTNFVARHLKGVDVHIDGIEANETGAAKFNERWTRDNISGECKIGLAENAPLLFDVGTYDAVVAFELIEHVPNVQSFLSTCEIMCKPTGRVYLSTPNGTFGQGNNPHHLRVYRAEDLFDVMRRRGKVQDMFAGPDGVVVGSYSPSPSLGPVVGIYCGAGWEPWSPLDIEGKGLGGSETAAVKLAEALSEKGCTVTVYGECEQCAYKQVAFRHHSAFDPSEARDLLIVSRVPQLFDGPINADVKVLWMHDTDYGDAFTAKQFEKMDRVFVLSDWHLDHVRSRYRFIDDNLSKLQVTRNAIEPSYFKLGEPLNRDPHRMAYTSSPDRGIDFLLEIWPKVRERVSDAELHFAYASVYDKVADKVPSVAKFRERVRELQDQPGVVNAGSLTQPQVAGLMLSSGVWGAPSWNTPNGIKFFETYCIGAVEAAAAGCCRVMSDWGALLERQRDGDPAKTWMVPGGSGSPDSDLWIEAIVAAMRWAEGCVQLPDDSVLEITWDGVADDFLGPLSVHS